MGTVKRQVIDDLREKISALETENDRLKSILKQHGIDPDAGNKTKFRAIYSQVDGVRKILGFRSPMGDEIKTEKAEWCRTCGNAECPLNNQDALIICESFVRRT